MYAAPDYLVEKAFEVIERAQQTVPFVLNSPHSGRIYPKRFIEMSCLDEKTIRRSEDYYVDELFENATALGIPMLKAHFPRAYLDVNREPYELDPRMFKDKLPSFTNRNSLRVAGGLGTVPRLVCEGVNIYASRLPFEEARQRIDGIYKPYHAQLRNLLSTTFRKFGHAVLIDCHSMPASVHLGEVGAQPDFIIGDRFGTSSAADLTAVTMETFRQMGYLVTSNKPYAGGFITEHYGRPSRGLHAVQIEVNRSLYIDEQSLKKRTGFDALKADIGSAMARISALDTSIFRTYSIAAE
ncbi:MAG: N-formylglutamate amidohydrolase [Ahrensia sp.]|nr:N-formylglutamate amidohydrolase [Ahrensia sp.]